MDTNGISLLTTHIPNTGGWTWGDLLAFGSTTLLAWVFEFALKFLENRYT
jgi:hypothetical protein